MAPHMMEVHRPQAAMNAHFKGTWPPLIVISKLSGKKMAMRSSMMATDDTVIICVRVDTRLLMMELSERPMSIKNQYVAAKNPAIAADPSNPKLLI